MRISDWSSDVCSSDLTTHCASLATPAECATALDAAGDTVFALVHLAGLFEPDPLDPASRDVWDRAIGVNLTTAYDMAVAFRPRAVRDAASRLIFLNSVAGRSEEHTSELQSLMRISYAVFCLKKKKAASDREQAH